MLRPPLLSNFVIDQLIHKTVTPFIRVTFSYTTATRYGMLMVYGSITYPDQGRTNKSVLYM